jgi:hypothetical protein
MSTFFPPHQPQPPDIDRAAEMRQARWDALKSRLDWDAIADEFIAQLKVRLNCRHHPVAELFDDLERAPLEDAFELEGFMRYLPTRTKVALGESLVRLLGEAQLHILSQLDERPF